MYVFILIFILVFTLWLFFIFDVWKIVKRKKLSASKSNYLIQQYNIIKNSADNTKEQIIDYDKLYHKILKDLWYIWGFWDILKLKPKEIPNINKIWELHKLRNKLVHDFDLLEETVLKQKALEYRKEIKNILRIIT